MADLENVVTSIVDMFVEHADSDGKISREEFEKMADAISNEEIKGIATTRANKFLDKNPDGQINFNRFCRLVAILARSHYNQGKDDEEEDE